MSERIAAEHTVIVQISDVHIAGTGNLHRSVDSLGALARILDAVEEAGDPPELLLFTGDLADSGEPEAYRRFRATVEPFAQRMAVSALYVPGNHDARAAFRAHLLGWDENEDVIDQVAWVGGLRVIALDSTVPGAAHGELDDSQLEWLEGELVTAAPLGTVVALHHPPIPGPKPFLNDIILRQPQRFAEVVTDRDVRMVLAGHTHHASAGVLGAVPVWVATASAYQVDVLAGAAELLRGVPGSAFTRIDITRSSAVATHIAMPASAEVIYEVGLETIRSYMRGEVSPEEFHHALDGTPVETDGALVAT
jgi:3',5'-cyclic-AMP phosphodiesterase